MDTPTPLILDFDLKQLQNLIVGFNEPKYRAQQIWEGVYRQLYDHQDQFTSLPQKFREEVLSKFKLKSINSHLVLKSKDGETEKYLYLLQDGLPIETVLMDYRDRKTICISTQSGCAMGCEFCATGHMGFKRSLSSGEIIEQVLAISRIMRDRGTKLTNIVVMGMGEPFNNYTETIKAIDCLNDPNGLNMGERRFTISTVGIAPQIIRFADEKRQINLAISLHAANNDLRSKLLPINRKYPIETVLEACNTYVQKTGRRISFEWALIQNVNDRPEDATELSKLIKGMLCHVNLIPLNPTKGYHGLGSAQKKAENFQFILSNSGIQCTIRLPRGIDIKAGCGQLAGEIV